MLRNEKVRYDQVVTTESNVCFFIFESMIDVNVARFTKLFFDYETNKVMQEIVELPFEEKKRISSNLSAGICDGKIYFAHDYKIDRNCYFGYVIENPEGKSEIMCKTVIYDHSNTKLQTRKIKNIRSVKNVAEDTYLINAAGMLYVVKYLRIKNIVLAVLDDGVIPIVGKKCSISKIDLTENKPFEVYKMTSKLLKVRELENVYICDTLNTQYIILKSRKNDVFGICTSEPVLEQQMKCHSMEFLGIKPYLTQFVTDIVVSVRRLGHIYVVNTKDKTYYMEARFRLV